MFAVGPAVYIWVGHEDWIEVTVEELRVFRARADIIAEIVLRTEKE